MRSSLPSLVAWLTAAVLLLLPGCGPTETPPSQPPDGAAGTPHRVLFIGNSLTEYNDLPGLVEALAHLTGVDSFETQPFVVAGLSLEDHLLAGGAALEIATGHWDVVVLQQGPSASPESRAQLRRDVGVFASIARDAGARIGVLGVWPAETDIANLDTSIESYRLAAADVGGLLFPAGAAWRAAWEVEPRTGLYGPDGFHPSILGTYLAALVVYARLFDRSPVGLPSRFRYGVQNGLSINIPAAEAEFLQNAAARALE